MTEMYTHRLISELLTDITSPELSTWAHLSPTTPSTNPFHPLWHLTYTP
jgi:hypothetical protein